MDKTIRRAPAAGLHIMLLAAVAMVACRPSPPDRRGASAPVDNASPPAEHQSPVPLPDSGEAVPGSLLVQSANEGLRVTLRTDRPGAFGIRYMTPNQPVDLVPWEYTIEVHNSSARRTVRAGERTTVTVGALVVTGGERTKYSVFDSAGAILWSPTANTPFELLPGDYLVEVNGSRTSATIREGQRTTIESGSILVKGMEGGDSHARAYRVLDSAAQHLSGAPLEEAIDLLPGDYLVDLHGSRAKQTVTAGQRSSISAGSLVVGSPKDKSFFLQTEGQTSAWGGGERVHLLPGTYSVVASDGRTLAVTIESGRTTTVP